MPSVLFYGGCWIVTRVDGLPECVAGPFPTEQTARLRPASDPAYLRQLSQRMSVMLGLPLKVARQRVKRMAISAGAARDPGSDARWWKAPRSRDRL